MKMKTRIYIILFSLFLTNLVEQPTPEIKIEQGILSGKVSADGSCFEYLGIPYGTTNISIRFQAPLPPPSWEGVFKAVDETSQCPQNFQNMAIGTEDCLKINVYVPVRIQKPLAVMVYVHGGAFMMGNGGKFMYDAEFLLSQNVIVVTFNYRIGTLGFLCLGTKEAPGNAGMKDQVAALRWVKKNIAAFGGDTDNITIFGHSAGGTSVSLLVASETTEGLFNKAIISSGSSISHWGINRDPITTASETAKRLGYNTEDPKKLYVIFSGISVSDLMKATAGVSIGHLLPLKLLQLPCIEKKFSGVEPFLTDFPYNNLKKISKNISAVMYGSTDREGLMFAGDETKESLETCNLRDLLYDDVEIKTVEEKKKVNTKIREFYFGNERVSKETLMNLTDLYSHLYFTVPVILEAELMIRLNKPKVYNYYFTYSGGRNLLKRAFGFPDEPGACHGDDIFYLFNSKMALFKAKGQDVEMINWMTKMFTNFAKYGDPTPNLDNLPVTWIPSKKDEVNVLNIGSELRMGPIPIPDAYQLWKDIYDKYRKISF